MNTTTSTDEFKSNPYDTENMTLMDLAAAVQNSMREQFDKVIKPTPSNFSSESPDDFGLIIF